MNDHETDALIDNNAKQPTTTFEYIINTSNESDKKIIAYYNKYFKKVYADNTLKFTLEVPKNIYPLIQNMLNTYVDFYVASVLSDVFNKINDRFNVYMDKKENRAHQAKPRGRVFRKAAREYRHYKAKVKGKQFTETNNNKYDTEFKKPLHDNFKLLKTELKHLKVILKDLVKYVSNPTVSKAFEPNTNKPFNLSIITYSLYKYIRNYHNKNKQTIKYLKMYNYYDLGYDMYKSMYSDELLKSLPMSQLSQLPNTQVFIGTFNSNILVKYKSSSSQLKSLLDVDAEPITKFKYIIQLSLKDHETRSVLEAMIFNSNTSQAGGSIAFQSSNNTNYSTHPSDNNNYTFTSKTEQVPEQHEQVPEASQHVNMLTKIPHTKLGNANLFTIRTSYIIMKLDVKFTYEPGLKNKLTKIIQDIFGKQSTLETIKLKFKYNSHHAIRNIVNAYCNLYYDKIIKDLIHNLKNFISEIYTDLNRPSQKKIKRKATRLVKRVFRTITRNKRTSNLDTASKQDINYDKFKSDIRTQFIILKNMLDGLLRILNDLLKYVTNNEKVIDIIKNFTTNNIEIIPVSYALSRGLGNTFTPYDNTNLLMDNIGNIHKLLYKNLTHIAETHKTKIFINNDNNDNNNLLIFDKNSKQQDTFITFDKDYKYALQIVIGNSELLEYLHAMFPDSIEQSEPLQPGKQPPPPPPPFQSRRRLSNSKRRSSRKHATSVSHTAEGKSKTRRKIRSSGPKSYLLNGNPNNNIQQLLNEQTTGLEKSQHETRTVGNASPQPQALPEEDATAVPPPPPGPPPNFLTPQPSPPPPPGAEAGAPPPPPPPPAGAPIPQTVGIGNLLGDIQKGKTLRKVNKEAPPPPGAEAGPPPAGAQAPTAAGRGNILAEIRQPKKLKMVTNAERAQRRELPVRGVGDSPDMQTVLKAAMDKRKVATHGVSDNEDSTNNNSNWNKNSYHSSGGGSRKHNSRSTKRKATKKRNMYKK